MEIQLKKQARTHEAQQVYPQDWKISSLQSKTFGSEMIVAEIAEQKKDDQKVKNKKSKIVLVHGLSPNGMQDWLKVVDHLRKSHDLILVDLPGFGFSGSPVGRYSPTGYAKVLHEVKQHYAPSGKWTVMGYSMGGAVSIRYTELYPEEVNRLVLVSVAGILERTTYLKHTVESLMEGYKPGSKFNSFIKSLTNPVGNLIESINGLPDPTQLLRYDRVWKKVFVGREEFNAGMALIEEDFSGAIHANSLPVSIIWGDLDKVAPLRTGKLLASKMPKSELNIIPGAGHTPMVTHTEQALKFMTDALDEEMEIDQIVKHPLSSLPPVSDQTLYLKDQDQVMIENIAYRKIKLIRCENVSFKNVRAESMELYRSRVSMENVELNSPETALSADQSVIEATNVILRGKNTVWSNKSRLDFVGAEIIGEEEGVRIKEKSQFLFSISKFSSPIFQGYIHGSYRLSKIVLDEHLVVNQ